MAVLEEISREEAVSTHNIPAPQIKRTGVFRGPGGDSISRFVLRMVRPNRECLPPAVMHTFEHLLSAYMKNNLEGYIDISPMGSRTGFILTIWGERDETQITDIFEKSLRNVVKTEWGKIPDVSESECGNYKDHSLYGAKKYSVQILEALIKNRAEQTV